MDNTVKIYNGGKIDIIWKKPVNIFQRFELQQDKLKGMNI